MDVRNHLGGRTAGPRIIFSYLRLGRCFRSLIWNSPRPRPRSQSNRERERDKNRCCSFFHCRVWCVPFFGTVGLFNKPQTKMQRGVFSRPSPNPTPYRAALEVVVSCEARRYRTPLHHPQLPKGLRHAPPPLHSLCFTVGHARPPQPHTSARPHGVYIVGELHVIGKQGATIQLYSNYSKIHW